MRVLIVEDQNFLANIYANFLEKAGYETAVEPDGTNAVTRMREWKPDAVLLDLSMPNKDGFAVLEERKLDPDARRVPVVVLSALERKGLEERLRELGANAYMHKVGLEPPALVKTVQGVVEKLIS